MPRLPSVTELAEIFAVPMREYNDGLWFLIEEYARVCADEGEAFGREADSDELDCCDERATAARAAVRAYMGLPAE